MKAARNAGDCVKSITSIDTSLAGTTRSGAHRRLPGPADRDTAASNESDSRAGDTRGIYSSNGTGFVPRYDTRGTGFLPQFFSRFNRHFTFKIIISSPDPPKNYFLLHFWAIISPKT